MRRSNLQCSSPACRSRDVETSDLVDVRAISAGEDGWTAAGEVKIRYCKHGRCRTCGQVFDIIAREIPLQLPSLKCKDCNSRKGLRYSVNALQKGDEAFEFTVDIACPDCPSRRRLTRVLKNLWRTFRIKVSLPGIEVETGKLS
jgi:hypothetical protein